MPNRKLRSRRQGEALWSARASQRDGGTPGRFHGFKRVALVPPVQIVLVRNGDGGIFAFFDYENEAGWITKGQRAQKNGVDHAEDGGVRADAQRQCDDGDRRKAWTLCQQPSRLLKKSIPRKLWRTISGTSAESIAFIFHAQPGLAVPQGFFSSLLEA